jgi:hypothetical protein
MTPAWVTKHRKALTYTGAGLGLILAGRFAHDGVTVRNATYGFVPWDMEFGWVSALRLMFGFALALLLMQVGTLILGSVRGLAGNGKASLGQGLAFSSFLWLASDKAEFDWRAVRITGIVTASLLVATYLPAWVWQNLVYVGAALLVGQVLGVFWTDLFTDKPRWAKWLPEPAPVQAVDARGDYWKDRKKIRKEWDKLVQDLMSKSAEPGAKVKAPKLVGDPEVDERSIRLVVEPPSMWTFDGLSQLAAGITNEWSGEQSQVREEKSTRMSKRRMAIEIAMTPLEESIAYPIGDGEYGAPIGVGLMGNTIRLEIGPRGVPHVLVAGQSGSGKSSAMRVIGLGMVAQGARVVCIDPKGEGDLEGISNEQTLFRISEWVDHFDWLWDEQERRAAIKLRGGDPGQPIVTMIDELTQITKGQGARTTPEEHMLKDAKKAYERIINIGRGTGLHIVSGIQQASAENMGGGTAIRDQHLGRILLGRSSTKENRGMVLGDRNPTAQDIEKMQFAPAGRAWVSGMTPRDTGLVHCVQIFDVPEMAGGGGVPVFDRTTPSPAPEDGDDTTAGSGEQDALRYLLADAVHQDGPLHRSVLCDRFGVAVTTARHVLRKAESSGWVRVESPGGNAPVVVHPAGVWPPPGR